MIKNISLDKFKILSGSMLKLIAIITMFIDHSASILRSELEFMGMPLFVLGETQITVYYIMRKIGRLAFPIFCFLIAEGFTHTKNQKKYGLRLLLFAVISEIPFNLMVGKSFFYLSKQNVYFTLFLGLMFIYIFVNVKSEVIKVVLMGIVAVIAIRLRVDYGLCGTLLILLIYILRNRPAAQAILSYPLLSGGTAAFAAFIPINMYNGQRGFIKSGVLKFCFYLFYPLHILFLLAIKFILSKYL